MHKFQAFTFKADGLVRHLKTSCGISEAYDPKLNNGKSPVIKRYEAIWDTGATNTVISAKVAADLGLKPTGLITSYHAGGVDQVPTYLINVYLPNSVNITGVKVNEGILPGDTEILIGMDIIALGDFAFTNVNGKSTFSFRIPSIKEIDYVKEAEKSKKPDWLKPSRGYKGGKKRR